MGLYRQHGLPRLTHLAMRTEQLNDYHRRVVSQAQGVVLELGFGSGSICPPTTLSGYPPLRPGARGGHASACVKPHRARTLPGQSAADGRRGDSLPRRLFRHGDLYLDAVHYPLC